MKIDGCDVKLARRAGEAGLPSVRVPTQPTPAVWRQTGESVECATPSCGQAGPEPVMDPSWRVMVQSLGSTDSLSIAKTPNTASCTLRRGSPRTNRSSDSIPSANSRSTKECFVESPRERSRSRYSVAVYSAPQMMRRYSRLRHLAAGCTRPRRFLAMNSSVNTSRRITRRTVTARG